MVRGLYTGWTGMYNEQKRLDVISNNLANSATVGFKKEGATSQSFDDMLTIKVRDDHGDSYIGNMSLGVKIGEIYTDYTQGSVRETGNTYDMAIEGNGFFTISYTDANGNTSTRYTRAGEFMITKEGYVVTSEGQHLMGESEWLQVPVDAAEVVINTDGTVYADGTAVDVVKLTDFENYDYLKKFGETMYQPVQGAVEKEATGSILQGYTEQSNVNVVSEMVNLINITRAYEANQKVIKAMDDLLQIDVSSVGKI